ncbi:hypothetical protein EEB12_29045 [Rhodococcus sp. WS1]|nr:hypothetical protein EEB12_29045 [Rhodococcus sp. WS1]
MLADLALGASARAEGGADKQMPTLSMTIQLARPLPPPGRIEVTTDTPAVHDRFLSTAGALRDEHTVIGHCTAAFAVGSAQAPRLPWEQSGGEAVAPLLKQDLCGPELQMFETVMAAESESWGDFILNTATLRSPSLRFQATPLMANRFGTVQGGLLFALAARGASAATSGPSRVKVGHVDFLAAGDVTQELEVSATVLSAGRRTSFVRAEITQGERLVATGSFVQQTVTPMEKAP